MTTLAFLNIGLPEWILIGVAAVLLFGRRLPDVGRDLGRGLIEFKKGLKGVKDEIDETDQAARQAPDATHQASHEEPTK